MLSDTPTSSPVRVPMPLASWSRCRARAQRRPPAPSLKAIAKSHPDRDEAMYAAWVTGEYSYAQIATHFGVHFITIGRVVRRGNDAHDRYVSRPDPTALCNRPELCRRSCSRAWRLDSINNDTTLNLWTRLPPCSNACVRLPRTWSLPTSQRFAITTSACRGNRARAIAFIGRPDPAIRA